MKKIVLTLLAVSLLATVSAQTVKCGIDTKALVREEVAAGAQTISFLVKVVPGFDRTPFDKANIAIGAQAGQVVTMSVPVESLGLLESNKEVLQYSISHRIAAPDCDKARADTRADSVQGGLGVTGGLNINGSGVLIGITDWGFDYTHPNYNGQSSSNYRLDRAWDQFKLSGPAPTGFNYGTEVIGTFDLLDAQGDTSNIYGYGTHGTHVAGIASGKGKAGKYRGMAPGARLLFCTFLLGEADWLNGVAWMKQVAQENDKRLVINSSWGMYSFSANDGTSLLSQAINSLSDSGIVFVTSAGNNGNADFHISKTFSDTMPDTLRSIVIAASNIYLITETGQCLIMWGEPDHDFKAAVRIKNGTSEWTSPFFNTAVADTAIYDTLFCGNDTVTYRALIEHCDPFSGRPHIQIDLDKTRLEKQLLVTATSGTVHAWNVVNQDNHAGNAGCYFRSEGREGFTYGDNDYGIGEPACAAKCISVAAHVSDTWTPSNVCITGDHANFTSFGPLIDGTRKPEISAPGSQVVSSISVWADEASSYTSMMSLRIGTNNYIWSSMSGTSMSCPVVTGIVALILQANPSLTVDEIRDIITSTARNDDKTGPLVINDSSDLRWGWGKIDALRAVNAAISHVSVAQAESQRLPLHVYPNPASGSLTINTGCGEPQTAEIYTAQGSLMKQMPVNHEASLDVSGWPCGVYILRVGSRIEKLIVQ